MARYRQQYRYSGQYKAGIWTSSASLMMI